MKTVKLRKLVPGNLIPCFFAFGILAVVLAGCFNPITVVPPKGMENPLAEPFSVDIMVGEDTQGRSLAGLSDARIKQTGAINVMQLIVVDKELKTIVGFDEARLDDSNPDGAILKIDAITYGRTYDFMLLMGYWKKSGENYVDEEPPTLLAAGLLEKLVSGGGKITITMWPLVVDTEFTTTDTEIAVGDRTTAPALVDGKPTQFNLFPVDWKVTWKVLKGTGGDGFSNLVAAQKVINPGAGDTLVLKSKNTIIRGTGLSDANTAPTVAGNIITLNTTKTYTEGITRLEATGSVNFKLEYIPFNLTASGAWKTYNSKSAFVLDGDDKQPVWIIRNGLNDDASNPNTDFTKLGADGTNGNGAVAFTIAANAPADPEHPQSGDLVIRDGIFEGSTGANTAKIGFTTAGYTGTAGVYYAVVADGAEPPVYSAYTGSLGPLAAMKHTGKEITLPGTAGYDVYVIVLKGGKMSASLKISTTAGGSDIDYEWGEGSGRFVAIDGGITIAWSDDGGQTWTAAQLSPNDLSEWQSVAYGDGVFVALGWHYSTITYIVIALSIDDGQTWNITETGLEASIDPQQSMAYGDGTFLMIFPTKGEGFLYTYDGGWDVITLPATDFYWSGATYGDGVFVMVGDGSAAWSDSGGQTWTAAGLGLGYSRVTYGNGVFIAVGDHVSWSDNGGKNWTFVTSPIISMSAGWCGIAYGKP
jgi:hypothetical protein